MECRPAQARRLEGWSYNHWLDFDLCARIGKLFEFTIGHISKFGKYAQSMDRNHALGSFTIVALVISKRYKYLLTNHLRLKIWIGFTTFFNTSDYGTKICYF